MILFNQLKNIKGKTMALQADSQGFLTGDTVTDIRRATDHLLAIRADIKAIRNAVSGVSPGVRESGNSRVTAQAAMLGSAVSAIALWQRQVG